MDSGADVTAADRHTPVMAGRVVELLAPALGEPGAVVVDATLGLGGHAEALLAACPRAQLLGIDRDEQALGLARGRLAAYRDRVRTAHARYDQLAEVLAEQGLGPVQAILFDLGVSSLQLDEADRGFAYRWDAPLDMRMDRSGELTAAQVLNTYAVEELARVLREHGEERHARSIAAAVVRRRADRPFTTSADFVALLRRVIPLASQRSGGHPAKRAFQALRIEVNGELQSWEAALPAAIAALGLGGRVAVLSYHSLEDRMAKRVLQAGARGRTPAGLPVELPDHAPYLRLLTRGAEEPSEQEVRDNPRSASARLRAAERVATTKGGPR